jgi:hypothetical protein
MNHARASNMSTLIHRDLAAPADGGSPAFRPSTV